MVIPIPSPMPSGAYEFMLADDSGVGVLLNSDASPTQAFVDITQVTGMDNSPFRETFRDHEGADGGFLDAEFEKGRDILLTGMVYSPTEQMEMYLDRLKQNYAPRRTSARLYFWTPGVGLRFINVKPRGVKYDWDTLRRTGTAAIQFAMYAEDPRFYSYPTLTASRSWTASPSSGFGFNFGFNFGFGTNTVPAYDTILVYNNGNRPAPVTITIFGPGINPRIINDTNGGEVLMNITLAGGVDSDELVLDMLNHSVTLNGTANRRNTVVVDNWFLLEPGSNTLRFQLQGGGGNPGQSMMFLEWTGAWR